MILSEYFIDLIIPIFVRFFLCIVYKPHIIPLKHVQRIIKYYENNILDTSSIAFLLFSFAKLNISLVDSI